MYAAGGRTRRCRRRGGRTRLGERSCFSRNPPSASVVNAGRVRRRCELRRASRGRSPRPPLCARIRRAARLPAELYRQSRDWRSARLAAILPVETRVRRPRVRVAARLTWVLVSDCGSAAGEDRPRICRCALSSPRLHEARPKMCHQAGRRGDQAHRSMTGPRRADSEIVKVAAHLESTRLLDPADLTGSKPAVRINR